MGLAHAVWATKNNLAKVLGALPPRRSRTKITLVRSHTGLVPQDYAFDQERFMRAFLWLKKNNVLYRNIEIDACALAEWTDAPRPTTVSLPTGVDSDEDEEDPAGIETAVERGTTTGPYFFVDEHAADAPTHAEEVAAAANVLHMYKKTETAQVHNTPFYFELAFPWLFPYGAGGPETQQLFKKHNHADVFKDLVCLRGGDRRFQLDMQFLFTAYSSQVRFTSSLYERS